VEGGGLEAIGIREGDHVALARDLDVAESVQIAGVAAGVAELAAVVGDDGTSALWACTREGARLRIGFGGVVQRGFDEGAMRAEEPATDDERTDRARPTNVAEPLTRLTSRHARVQGVVVAVLRREG
jgi:hypothetical protein